MSKRFIIIDGGSEHISIKGYEWADNSERFIDKELIERTRYSRGNRFIDDLFDDFYEGFIDIATDENGDLYGVIFIHEFEKNEIIKKPAIWQHVKKSTKIR